MVVSLLLCAGCAALNGADAEPTRLITPVVGWQTGDQGCFYPCTPFAGLYTGARRGFWVFPACSYRRELVSSRVSGNLLWGQYWYQSGRSECHLFPLWYCRDHGEVRPDMPGRYGTDRTVLLLFRRRDQSFVEPPDMARTDVTRYQVRFVWQHAIKTQPDTGRREKKGSVLLFLCEYLNDRPGPGDQQGRHVRFSLLHKLFRYERFPSGSQDLYLLFVPVF